MVKPGRRKALSRGKREGALDDSFATKRWLDSVPPGKFPRLAGWRMLFFLGTAKDWLIDRIGSTTLDAFSGSQQFYTWALVSLLSWADSPD